jgi:hypothetical protein
MPQYTPPPRRPRPVIFWIIAAIVIAALIVAWIFWANNLGKGVNPRTNVPMTPGYAPATSTGAHPAVPANQALRPAPAASPGAARESTTLPSPPASGASPPSGGTH